MDMGTQRKAHVAPVSRKLAVDRAEREAVPEPGAGVQRGLDLAGTRAFAAGAASCGRAGVAGMDALRMVGQVAAPRAQALLREGEETALRRRLACSPVPVLVRVSAGGSFGRPARLPPAASFAPIRRGIGSPR